jgi:hypothetical protein
MNIRRAFGVLRVWAALSVCAFLLSGCAVGVVADIVSVGTSGKSVMDHVLDAATGKDCNLFQGVSRSDRDVCEPRESDATKHDFKGLAGLVKGLSDKSPTNNETAAQEVHSPVETADAENAPPQLEATGKPISLEPYDKPIPLEADGKPISLKPNGKPIPSDIFRAPVGAQ